MELKGKLLFGIAGMIIGDLLGLPFGAIAGFFIFCVIGHYMYDKPKEQALKQAEFSAYYRRRGQLIYYIFSLCAKLAKADGHITSGEISHMERLMRQPLNLHQRGRLDAIQVWNKAKEAATPFDSYARDFYRIFGRQRHEVINMMDILFGLAAADGNLTPREEELLLRAAGIFHISRLQYDRLKSRYFQLPPNRLQTWTPLDAYYAILGAEPHESLDTIKKKFRALAIKWHPDKLLARGAGPEALRHAKEKFQQINEAYEKITNARKV